jgi:hypothetical protein
MLSTLFVEDCLAHEYQGVNNDSQWSVRLTVLPPAQEFFTYMETSPLPMKDCKI